VFLVDAREEARHVFERDDRDVEGVTEPDKAGQLVGRIDVQTAGHHFRLVGDDSHRIAVHPGKPDNDVPGKPLVDLHEIAFVDDAQDDFPDVVHLRPFHRHHVDELFIPTVVFHRLSPRRLLPVVLRQETQEAAHHLQRFLFGRRRKMGVAADGGMDPGTAQIFGGNFLAGHGLDHFRAGNEHLARFFQP